MRAIHRSVVVNETRKCTLGAITYEPGITDKQVRMRSEKKVQNEKRETPSL